MLSIVVQNTFIFHFIIKLNDLKNKFIFTHRTKMFNNYI